MAQPGNCRAVAESYGPIVGEKTDDYNWHFVDTVAYSWCVVENGVPQECSPVGTVRTYATIKIDFRTVLWYQAIDAADGPPIQGAVQWNCVDDNGLLPNSSCSGGWQKFQNFRAHTMEPIGVEDDFELAQAETYWVDFRYTWQAKGYPNLVWNHGAFTSRRLRCDDFACTIV